MKTSMEYRTIMILLITVLGLSFPAVTVHAATVQAVYGTTPTIDGIISAGEWTDASTATFDGPNGLCTVYVKQNGTHLHVGIHIPDTTLNQPVIDEFRIFFDTVHNHGLYPIADDYFLRITRPISSWSPMEYVGTGFDWFEIDPPSDDWVGDGCHTSEYWQVELSISYLKLGIVAGGAKQMGIEFGVVDNSIPGPAGEYFWTVGGDTYFPDSWGDIASTDLWVPWFTSLPMALLASAAAVLWLRRKRHRIRGDGS